MPHLIVVATGEDLGPMIDERTTWNGKAGGEVYWGEDARWTVVFDQPDCRGTMMIFKPAAGAIPALRPTTRITSPRLSFLKLMGTRFESTAYASMLHVAGDCTNVQGNSSLIVVVDTNVPAKVYTDPELAVDLR